MHSDRTAIVLTAHKRPQRLDRLLASVAAAEGARDWPVFVGVEPTERLPEIEQVLAHHGGTMRITHRVNAQPRGVRYNPFETIEWAFQQQVDTVLLLEDDLIIDRHALALARRLAAGPLHEAGVMCANLLATTCMSESVFMPAAGEAAALAPVVLRGRFFSSYGLLFNRAQWRRHFVPEWFVDQPPMLNFEGRPARGWDVALTRHLLLDPGLHVLQSLLPRVSHDGADGTHVDERFQSQSFAHVRLGLDGATELPPLQLLDPVQDLSRIPSASARMYVNLARHLWTLQGSALATAHAAPDLLGAKLRWWRLGSHRYALLRKRAVQRD